MTKFVDLWHYCSLGLLVQFNYFMIPFKCDSDNFNQYSQFIILFEFNICFKDVSEQSYK